VRRTIFVVSSDDRLRAGLVEGLAERGFEVHATRGDAVAAAVPPELIVLDVSGDLRLLRDMREVHAGARIVALVPYPSAPVVFAALRLGAAHCIARTGDAETVLGAFAEAEGPPDALVGTAIDFPTLDDARAAHIGSALQLAGGNISRAARLLGIHRQSLQRILRQARPVAAIADADADADADAEQAA